MLELPVLPYDYAALAPIIDEETMKLHHDKHHATYVNKYNEMLAKYPQLEGSSVEDLLLRFNEVPADAQSAVRNHGGGHLNHVQFWEVMKPGGAQSPTAKLAELITAKFGGFTEFKQAFTDKALGLFGSGWTWLVQQGDDIQIITTPNQDSPIMQGANPLLGLDVWEHAYYLSYQNRRPEYVEKWWGLVNWDIVSARIK